MACARIEPPPGGPPDNAPPALIAVRPESMAVYPRFDGAVEFHFDEVISEGGQASMGLGTSDLERLIILSPTTRIPKVSWKRNVIAVEPREGWQPNRVYRVELLPGVTDLRRNQLDTGTVITFSTGAPLPAAHLSGTVIDWAGGRPAALALIEALLLPDSLSYRALADSGGRFDLGPIPAGRYLLYGAVDQNRNRRRDGREAVDSLLAGTDSAAPAVLWAAVRDTVGPRLTNVATTDSGTIDLTFSQPVDPYQRFVSAAARVITATADSTPLPVISLLAKAIDDSLRQLIRSQADSAAPDSARARLDSARSAAAERLKPPPGGRDSVARALLRLRPPLSDHLVLRIAAHLQPGGKYVVQVFGIRNLNGAAADSRQLLNIPEPPPPAASTPPDSTRRDSTPPAPPRPQR